MRHNVPTSIVDLERLVQLEVPESLHLDYKRSPAMQKKCRDEIVKDVSAFANSDGGTLIYGIEEREHKPLRLDGGVEHSHMSPEWLGQILRDNISPSVSGIEIVRFDGETNKSYYAIGVPKSFKTPHQASCLRYYRRSNFESVPMEHYEIEDLRRRSDVVPPCINVLIEQADSVLLFVVENIGTEAVRDVQFRFSDGYVWPPMGTRVEMPLALRQGFRFFPPRRRISYYYLPFYSNFSEAPACSIHFTVTVTCSHPFSSAPMSEDFFFDLSEFQGAARDLESPAAIRRTIADGLQNLCKAFKGS